MHWLAPFGGRPMPGGPPEWPRAGGILMQPSRLADAVEVLSAEWGHVGTRKREAKQAAGER